MLYATSVLYRGHCRVTTLQLRDPRHHRLDHPMELRRGRLELLDAGRESFEVVVRGRLGRVRSRPVA
jgi:hypothetical protein